MNSYRKYGLALLAGAMLVAGWAGNALALTNACTTISNQASLTYSVGGTPQTPVLSDDPNVAGTQATEFFVATKVDLTVAGAVTTVVPGATDRVITYSITNTGNDTQRYMLRLWAAANGEDGGTAYTDNFNATNIRVYYDTDATYNGGAAQTQIGGGPVTPDGSDIDFTPNVTGNNGVIYVHVVADIPNTQVDGDDALYALQAVTHQRLGLNGDDGGGNPTNGGETTEGAATTNGCGNVVVLADGDVDGVNDFSRDGGGTLSDTSRNGDGYAVGVYTVSTATISMSKSYTVIWDPINLAVSPKAIPGARIQYTMTITNSSTTTAASTLELIDAIPANTDYYVTTPAAEDTGTGTLNLSKDNQGSWGALGTATAGANGADPAVTHVRVQIPSLPFDDGAGPNDNTAAVTFIVVIE